MPGEHDVTLERLDSLIYDIRGEKVTLDSDLARLYGVATKAFNQAVKRNQEKFPSDFVFRLTPAEAEALRSQRPISAVRKAKTNRSQIVTSSQKHRDPRHLPYAVTEHGAIMAANVLNSPQAARMSVFVVRAFIAMRRSFTGSRELARKLAALEKELKERLDVHEAAIVTILQRVMDIIDPPPQPEPPSKQIGFHVRERSAPYRTQSKKAMETFGT
jgi:ORF6N domain